MIGLIIAFAAGWLIREIHTWAEHKNRVKEYFGEAATQDAYHTGTLSLYKAKEQRWHNNAFDFHFKKGDPQ